ncbi:pyruvate dehydrogenase E1 component alpha subunit/2-oxoisovalerate dehydrogenase E1 component [Haladaptatus litoreus]|uniref:Pyruvate dehydrogenase E1 component alpha subunit/2-oxoisovalerate dehydrogenase E1 component n=1 Tax=Haladaptatus litoreus TaxID=553468 RepID=A0A1N7E3V7_9EURY|nr:pyruvate dehydrogenase (acetyl-transferring) E1 component subunit alpha [Haladaptatus litoreus]SIR82716.1 pyruvate dehydrogenase E1 component alpha subunit/2-oxoisovalerate dehydrogenase E1 component [Haladaptatus litoreus]
MPIEDIAQFTIESVQVLSEEGTVDEDLVPSLTDDQLLEMYEQMKRSRRLDERAISLQRRGELGTYAPAIGQEAAQVASAFALADEDWVVPSFREQTALLVRGIPPHQILWYALGMEEGAEIPEGEHAFPPAIPVGTQPLHAVGVGWGEALQGRSNVAITYFGDGATSEGDVYEALNFAGVYDAQTVFVCQNNRYAISTRLANQTAAETLAQKAVAAGIDGVRVDGNDVLAVYRVAQDAIEKARNGEPTLIEALTYRRSMHTTSDDPSVYREAQEEEEWEARDPIVRFQVYLMDQGILDEETKSEIDERIETELGDAIDRAKAGREAIDPADMFRFAYEEIPAEVERQFEAFEGGTHG